MTGRCVKLGGNDFRMSAEEQRANGSATVLGHTMKNLGNFLSNLCEYSCPRVCFCHILDHSLISASFLFTDLDPNPSHYRSPDISAPFSWFSKLICLVLMFSGPSTLFDDLHFGVCYFPFQISLKSIALFSLSRMSPVTCVFVFNWISIRDCPLHVCLMTSRILASSRTCSDLFLLLPLRSFGFSLGRDLFR
jgi:hypothetical protein